MQLTNSIRIAALLAAATMVLLGFSLLFSVTAWGSEWFEGLSLVQQYWAPKLALAVTFLMSLVGVWLRRRQRKTDQDPA